MSLAGHSGNMLLCKIRHEFSENFIFFKKSIEIADHLGYNIKVILCVYRQKAGMCRVRRNFMMNEG